jgi:hypothetical protein
MTLINFPKTAVPISLHADVKAFFGPQDQDEDNAQLKEYLRGGRFIPSVNEGGGNINTGVPSSGPINLTDLLGTQIDFYLKTQFDAVETWSFYDSQEGETTEHANGTRQIYLTHVVGASAADEFEMAIGAKGQSQFRWKYVVISGDNADVNISSPIVAASTWSGWNVSHDEFTLNLDIVNNWANTTVLIDVYMEVRSTYDTDIWKPNTTRRMSMAIIDLDGFG